MTPWVNIGASALLGLGVALIVWGAGGPVWAAAGFGFTVYLLVLPSSRR